MTQLDAPTERQFYTLTRLPDDGGVMLFLGKGEDQIFEPTGGRVVHLDNAGRPSDVVFEGIDDLVDSAVIPN